MRKKYIRRQDRPQFKQCRHCGEWYSPLAKQYNPKQRFCTVGCAAAHRAANPKWRREHSRRLKGKFDPEVMRERSRALWRDPEIRARLVEKIRARTNGKEHLAWMAKHNKKIWADPRISKRILESLKKAVAKKWQDPAYVEKMSALTTEANKKRWADPEYKRRVSARIRRAKRTAKGRKRQSDASREAMARPEMRALRSQMMKDRWADPEQRAVMTERSRETARAKMNDPARAGDRVAKLVAAARSPEARARMSERNKKLWADPEYRARQKALWTPERSALQSELNRKRWRNPKYKARLRKKISRAKRRAWKARQKAGLTPEISSGISD